MRVISTLLLVAALFQLPPPAFPAVWPPAGVLTEKDLSAKPALMTRVDPTYTREAMRAKIQGFVTLQFIVETDGSVREVRVITPLDPTNGLDAAAIAALKKWKFKPGMKDGEPVRVLATFMQVFSIRDLPPPMTLPTGFELERPSAVSDWVHTETPTDGIDIDFSYPRGWVRGAPPSGAVISVLQPASLHSVVISAPRLLPADIPFPMAVAQLAQFSEAIRMQSATTSPGMVSLGAGQSTLGSANWLWLEMEASTSTFASAPPELAAFMRNGIDSVHIWAFSTSVTSRLVQVMCITPNLKAASLGARDEGLAAGRGECADMIKRMKFTSR